jgi:hypothetical protein
MNFMVVTLVQTNSFQVGPPKGANQSSRSLDGLAAASAGALVPSLLAWEVRRAVHLVDECRRAVLIDP